MKKLFISLFVVGISISSFAASIALPPKWSWDTEDVSLIDSFIEFHMNNKKQSQVINCKIMKALVGKDATNMTYEEFKTIIFKIVSENSSLKDKRLEQMSIKVVAMTARCIKRFNSFKRSIINDPDSTDNSYIFIHLVNKNTELSDKEWRQIAVDKYLLKANNDIRCYQTFIDRYEKGMINFTKEEINKDMNLIKKLVYPKLSNDEKFKPIAVKIELILKSVQ